MLCQLTTKGAVASLYWHCDAFGSGAYTSRVCGRYSLGKKPKHWSETAQPFLPRYNIAPGQDAAVFTDHHTMQSMRWGLVPFWSESEGSGYKMINARAESLSEKPAFRRSLESRRCVVPADSFYEWRKETKPRLPVRFLVRDREPFLLAGLWDNWRKPDGTTLKTFTIVTTEANDLVRRLHDRMPVILNSEAAAEWLDTRELPARTVSELLRPYPAVEMVSYPISSRINSTAFDDLACIEPAPESPAMLPGF